MNLACFTQDYTLVLTKYLYYGNWYNSISMVLFDTDPLILFANKNIALIANTLK